MNAFTPAVPPVSAPRRDPRRFLFAPPVNHWVRMLYAALIRLRCLLECEGGIITTGAVTLTAAPAAMRDEEQLARKTYAVNEGKRPAYIYEAGALIAVAPALSGVKLPLPGLLAITAAAAGAEWAAIGAVDDMLYEAGPNRTTIYAPAPFTYQPDIGETIRINGDLFTVAAAPPADYAVVVSGNATALIAVGETVELKTAAVVTVTTYKYCKCGVKPTYAEAGPVGGFLL